LDRITSSDGAPEFLRRTVSSHYSFAGGCVCGNSNGGAQLRPLLSTEACRRARETRSGPTGQNKGSRKKKEENSDSRPPTFHVICG
jgi:hypothetical protein